MSEKDDKAGALRSYYRWHAWLYDSTRWAFLFGRCGLIDQVAAEVESPARILEIGCGTGKNLVALAKAFPRAIITGLDLSQDMLDRARRKIAPYADRIELLHRPYDGPVAEKDEEFDLIVLSYSLSMINPGYEDVILWSRKDLRPGGSVAVVDFHDTRWDWFRHWMGINHVRMEGQILDQLGRHYDALLCRVRCGYVNMWRYFVFVGK